MQAREAIVFLPLRRRKLYAFVSEKEVFVMRVILSVVAYIFGTALGYVVCFWWFDQPFNWPNLIPILSGFLGAGAASACIEREGEMDSVESPAVKEEYYRMYQNAGIIIFLFGVVCIGLYIYGRFFIDQGDTDYVADFFMSIFWSFMFTSCIMNFVIAISFINRRRWET